MFPASHVHACTHPPTPPNHTHRLTVKDHKNRQSKTHLQPNSFVKSALNIQLPHIPTIVHNGIMWGNDLWVQWRVNAERDVCARACQSCVWAWMWPAWTVNTVVRASRTQNRKKKNKSVQLQPSTTYLLYWHESGWALQESEYVCSLKYLICASSPSDSNMFVIDFIFWK